MTTNVDVEGKICGACLNTYVSEYFSKKQWKQKQRRRCKKCADAEKEIDVDGLSDMLQSLNTDVDDDRLVIGAPLRFKVSMSIMCIIVGIGFIIVYMFYAFSLC